MTHEMLRSPTYPRALRFAVVITDGHVTGSPCGGIKVAAEKARDEGIRIFVVAASKNVDENGLKEIANSPATVYRREFMAVDFSQGRAQIHTETIDRIIKTMVLYEHISNNINYYFDALLTLCLICFFRNIWPTLRYDSGQYHLSQIIDGFTQLSITHHHPCFSIDNTVLQRVLCGNDRPPWSKRPPRTKSELSQNAKCKHT